MGLVAVGTGRGVTVLVGAGSGVLQVGAGSGVLGRAGDGSGILWLPGVTVARSAGGFVDGLPGTQVGRPAVGDGYGLPGRVAAGTGAGLPTRVGVKVTTGRGLPFAASVSCCGPEEPPPSQRPATRAPASPVPPAAIQIRLRVLTFLRLMGLLGGWQGGIAVCPYKPLEPRLRLSRP